MTLYLRLAVTLLGASPVAAAQAQACSVANPPATTAAERIAGRTDLRVVRGTLGLQAVGGGGSGKPQQIWAHISTETGEGIDVAYLYDSIWVSCEIYFLPQADADGTFYVARSRKSGRYELIDWVGAYAENGHRIDEDGDEPPTPVLRRKPQ